MIRDVTGPTLAFTQPVKSPLKIGDSLDITLTSNLNGATVHLFDDGAEVASGFVSGGSITFSDINWDIMLDGSHVLTATVSDAAGNGASGT